MSVTTYPDGTQLLSTALTDTQVQTVFQLIAAQMIGLLTAPLDPQALPNLPEPLADQYAANPPQAWTVSITLTAGQLVATVASVINLYEGASIACSGLPDGTVIVNVGPGNQVFLSSPTTESGMQTATVTDPAVFSKVRQGFQQQGQPGQPINGDTAYVRCIPIPAEYSQGRDFTQVAGETTITLNDVFSRAWKTSFVFYGPNALDHARAIRSALIKIDLFSSILAVCNLYVNPNIEEPSRGPLEFQGQWWERVDLTVILNEQITESYVVNADASVDISLYTEAGKFLEFTAKLP